MRHNKDANPFDELVGFINYKRITPKEEQRLREIINKIVANKFKECHVEELVEALREITKVLQGHLSFNSRHTLDSDYEALNVAEKLLQKIEEE